MKITLVRHTSLNIASHVCYGQSDVAVSHNFESECRQLQLKLAAYKFDAIYSSPLQRCLQLAQSLCTEPALGLVKENILIDSRLKELHFGDWEMQAWDAIPREVFDVWANDYANLAPPSGETFTQLHARCTSFVDEVRLHPSNQHILVVTHGGLIRAMIAEVLQIPLKRLFRISIDHASVTQLEFKGGVPKILFMNL